jgi:hypothetical protein
MKMLPTVLCLSASAIFLVAAVPADASGKSAKERQLRQQPLPQSSNRHRPDYYEHLVERHQIGSALWWELTRRNRR